MKSVTRPVEGKDYAIIDDFLSVGDQERLKSLSLSPEFTYRIYESHRGSYDHEKYVAPLQFSHHLYMEGEERVSPHFGAFSGIYLKLKQYFGNYTLLRSKVNISTILPPIDYGKSQVPHVDLEYDNSTPVAHWVALYYLNGSDGNTFFYNSSEEILRVVEPKANRLLLFNGSLLHAASNPAFEQFRIIVNTDLQPEFVKL
jgi:hypothetical protein